MKMKKKVLIIINPCSGTRKANKHLTDIVDMFTRAGYQSTVLTTTKQGDGTAYALEYAAETDLIVAVGGDGTFNEVAAGVMESGTDVPVGYIPSGSTNDFASSLGLSKNIIDAAQDIVSGEIRKIDMGTFNGRVFSYVASFGAFTEASYGTPQNIKNALGHLAYVLQGIKSISAIKKEHMVIDADGVIYEDDYLFGAVCNSTSIAGILTLHPDLVDMSDGKFELLLIKAPKDLLELAEIVHKLSTQNYQSPMLTFINCSNFEIKADPETDWSLDGEYQKGCEDIKIDNHYHAISLKVPEQYV